MNDLYPCFSTPEWNEEQRSVAMEAYVPPTWNFALKEDDADLRFLDEARFRLWFCGCSIPLPPDSLHVLIQLAGGAELT